MPSSDLALMAHLLRRAGFGATREEIETYAAKGYEETVEDLVNPERCPAFDDDIMSRYYGGEAYTLWAAQWIYRMVASKRPLVEKMALFWHHVFATGYSKVEHVTSITGQAEMFRRFGLTDFRTLLIELSKDPAMIYWLDNNENKNGEPNENYGRELLELFSMGVGNYTEDDIKNASRAFTGWTFTQPIPVYPQGNFSAEFVFKPEEHDYGEKTFLGHTGNFNGEDIIDIIVEQEATARFISRTCTTSSSPTNRRYPLGPWSRLRTRRPSTTSSRPTSNRTATFAPSCALCSTRTTSRRQPSGRSRAQPSWWQAS